MTLRSDRDTMQKRLQNVEEEMGRIVRRNLGLENLSFSKRQDGGLLGQIL